MYNSIYDFYFDAGLGCGGTTPYERFYYKNRYTTDDDHAYVYTSTAFMSPTEGSDEEDVVYNVYCDIAYLKQYKVSEDARICATLNTYDEVQNFTLDSSNYEQYSNYRFVFDKASDGNYYFNKVEKL